MKSKAPDQIELDFEGAGNSTDAEKDSAVTGCFRYFHPLCLGHPNEGPASTLAEVFSFSDKVAQKEQEADSKLYEGILSRIKHLQL